MASTSLEPQLIPVNRSTLRSKQREYLGRATGRKVLLVKAERQDEEEKYVVDKRYFEDLVSRLESTIETLEIVLDRRLFNQILATADDLEEQMRQGKLRSFGEVFPEE